MGHSDLGRGDLGEAEPTTSAERERADAPDTTVLEFEDNSRLIDLCGAHDRNLAVIETRLRVSISRVGNVLTLAGRAENRAAAARALDALYRREAGAPAPDFGEVEAAARLAAEPSDAEAADDPSSVIKIRGKTVRPRSAGQRTYVRALTRNALVFGIGPAGTGKTFLAVAKGVALLRERHVDRIILSRPAVEAGERLGFLPGDVKEKIDPYLRPLYDALEELWPEARIEKLMEDGRLEVAPLAFMRGRTLKNAFVVLDEAQNATTTQMRMFLTRLGENSQMVVNGDPSQIDLPRGVTSGLVEALATLREVEGLAMVRLSDGDVVRHPLVARIVKAYAAQDADADAAARPRAKPAPGGA
ncbi:MAG: PhoH family protein [Pseudomonadota bacterium]